MDKLISEMNQPSALEIKLVENLFDKEALNFSEKETSYLQYRELIIVPFFPFFILKNSEMRSKMEQLETRLQDSEHEVSLKRTPGREE